MATELSFQSTNEIKQYQNTAFAQLLEYLQHNSPFYKELFNKHHIEIKNIKTIDDLVQIPATDKNDFSTRNFDFLCVERNKIIDYATTSGTMGRPVTIAVTESDLQRLAVNEAQSFACAAGGSTDIYQLMLTIDRQFMAGLAYLSGIRKMGAGAIRIGPASPKIQWESILSYKPNSIVVVPSFILKLMDYAALNGIDLNNSGIEKAICIGEPVRNGDLTPNALAKRIHEKWNIKLFSTYASTEMQTAFTECEHLQGGHLKPDLLIVEVLNDQGQPLGPGEFGEVTITTLGVEGMPVLRYRTGDVCCYYNEPCKCGRNSIRLSPVVGRKNQMIKFRGTTFFPQAISDALRLVPEVNDYLLEVMKNELENDEVIIHIHQTGNIDIVEEKIKASLKDRIRVIPILKFVSGQQIQQFKMSDSRKPVSVVFRQVIN